MVAFAEKQGTPGRFGGRALLSVLSLSERKKMGRYDNISDSKSSNAIALWKTGDKDHAVPLKELLAKTFCNFKEAGNDDAPQLICEDENGDEWTMFGAWDRNVKKVAIEQGTTPGNWTAKLSVHKNGKQLELVPVVLRVEEEIVV